MIDGQKYLNESVRALTAVTGQEHQNTGTTEHNLQTGSKVFEQLDKVQETGAASSSGAMKLDEGKPRFDLMPVGPLFEVIKVYTLGAKKYGDRNMQLGMPYGRIIRAGLSHFFKWINGEVYDQTDGQHHLASVVWCCLTLMDYETRCPKFDDRSPSFTLSQEKWREHVREEMESIKKETELRVDNSG